MADVFKFSGGFGDGNPGDVTCDLCREEHQSVTADGYCQDCDDYLCQPCYNIHKKTRPTQNHRLLNKNIMPPCTVPENKRLRKNISTMCSKHADKPVEYFCKSHSYLGCSSCFILEHRTCRVVESISEKADVLLGGKEYTDFMADLEALQRASKDVVEWSRANISKSKISLSNAHESIKKFRREINDSIDAIELDLKTQAEKIKHEDEIKMDSIISEADKCMKGILKISADIRSLERKNKVCEMYISMLKADKEMKSAKQSLDNAKRKNTVRLYQFTANSSLKNTLKTPGILGTISMDTTGAGTAPMGMPQYENTGKSGGFNLNQQRTNLAGSNIVATQSLQTSFFGAASQNAYQTGATSGFGSQPIFGNTPEFGGANAQVGLPLQYSGSQGATSFGNFNFGGNQWNSLN